MISLSIGVYEEITGLEEFAWIEGVAIMISVVVIVLVNSLSDFQRERQFKALNDLASDRAVIVQQSGAKKQISIFDVLVGDIVHLQPGDIYCRWCCDRRILVGRRIKFYWRI